MTNIVNLNVENLECVERQIQIKAEGLTSVYVVLMYVKGCSQCVSLKESLLRILSKPDSLFSLYFVDADKNNVFDSTLLKLDGDKLPMINIFKDGLLKCWSYGYRAEEQLEKLIGLYLT